MSESDPVDRLTAQLDATVLNMRAGGGDQAPSPSAWESLRLRIPNPFEVFSGASRHEEEAAADEAEDEAMATASPIRAAGRVGTMPAQRGAWARCPRCHSRRGTKGTR
jgi:hypothetical protein